MNTKNVILIVFVLNLAACSSNLDEETIHAEIELPEHISQLKNLRVYSTDIQDIDSVTMVQETVFESGDEVFMSGYISKFAVDDSDRVYILSSVPGNLGVYIFNPDGSYLTTIGSFGLGPGEFEAIGSIDILDDELLLFDPRLQKFAVYSLDNFEKTDEVVIELNEAVRADSLPAIARGRALVLSENGTMTLEVGVTSLTEENEIDRIFYYALQRDGLIQPGRIMEVESYTRYFLPEREGWALPVIMPFTRSSLVSINRSGRFYTSWSEDFLIREYDPGGNYVRSFYYPVQKSEFSLDQIEIADNELRMLRNHERPETWPALHTMELDDEERLWMATITESDSTYQWWVLGQDGKLLARFTNPGFRSSRSVVSKPLITIKNGYFYSHKRDTRAGIDRIIKYKITFKPH